LLEFATSEDRSGVAGKDQARDFFSYKVNIVRVVLEVNLVFARVERLDRIEVDINIELDLRALLNRDPTPDLTAAGARLRVVILSHETGQTQRRCEGVPRLTELLAHSQGGG
jgi:hypothetical protein